MGIKLNSKNKSVYKKSTKSSNISTIKNLKFISLEEKISILENFDKTDETLTGSTVYNGFPVGKWSIQIRSHIRNNILKPTSNQLERLEKLGILERQIDSSVDEKIDSLINWIQKYPLATVHLKVPLKNLNLQLQSYNFNSLENEYEKMLNYYSYIRDRFSKKKLSNDQIFKCKEGNLGGVFGYSSKIQSLAKNYDVSEKIIYNILSVYGTIENFCNLYRNGKLYGKDFSIANSMINSVFDIDSYPNKSVYDDLFTAILGKSNQIRIYSSKKLAQTLELIPPSHREKLYMRFGLIDGKKKALSKVSKYYDISIEAVRKIELSCLKFLKSTNVSKNFFYKLDINSINCENISKKEKQLLVDLVQNLDNPEKSDLVNEGFNIIKRIYNINSKEKPDLNFINPLNESANIDDLAIINNLFHYLSISGFKTLEDISKLTKKDLKNVKHIGDKKIDKIINILHKNGLYLQDEISINIDFPAEININSLNLSNRTFNCLKREHLLTLGDISNLTKNDLISIKQLGDKSINEIITVLNTYGLSLKEEVNINSQIPTEIEIKYLNLPIRTLHALEDANLKTLGDISTLTKSDLAVIRNIGNTGLNRIIYVLAEYGLSLKPDKKSELEHLRIKKDKLQLQLDRLKKKVEKAEDLLNEYNNLLDNNSKENN